MGLRLSVLALLVALPALAKPWNSIEPGVSLKDAVLKKFGEPTKVTTVGGREVLSYSNEKAIKNTAQTQFRVDPTTGVVERIDVFPEATISIDQEAIEKSYGIECVGNDRDGCYVKRAQDKKPAYFLYAKLGVAIFFKEDGKVVSMAYLPGKK